MATKSLVEALKKAGLDPVVVPSDEPQLVDDVVEFVGHDFVHIQLCNHATFFSVWEDLEDDTFRVVDCPSVEEAVAAVVKLTSGGSRVQ